MLEKLFSLGYSKTFAERYYQLWGERAIRIAEAMEKPLPRCFRVNTLKGTISEITKRLMKKGFQFTRVPWAREGFCLTREPFSITSTPEYLTGLIYIQEASSMYPPVALDPKPGEIVADMAAAPGGKTSYMAQLMENKGLIFAFDVDEERLKETRLNLSRLGVLNTILIHKSSLYIDELNMSFDKILLDAPCTGSGTIHKNPERKHNRTLDDIKFCQGLQMKMIEKALEVLKPGGILVYSTCSLEPEENEFVIQWALDNFDIELLPLRYGEPALINPFGIELSPEIKKARRFYPDTHKTSGFFIAKIRKKG
ncbi:SAM-dependent tRNA/rRNA cytosine-C5 methylase [Pyrococcus furiosus DSM 3638]|uniref:Nucleolar protein III (Nol1-nop2-sun family) n=3 Tax=Pyrococcus furiosus TaxID=2261 RepID=Q8U1F1_PYRFU|nr:RsmB/NOP family class I SAM-dependent RNA methyltransferase [Pyrococcus furiosus]AAL81381.1 putative nucleolar protein III (nol1-nop2-sun family) [Pyrococcus furiosus DSM 3638]AFN04039.1 nol1-nop2-sun family nucleolar protein III [Pyrococcus furiosus COM1]QEK78899.1 SAM-dependent tRNA/rRNA cytosine-C5 methylase [Pyrococcus furiosus DSM 3638]